MKHTSIRLSEAHADKIAATGQSPTTIIKKALDLYFNMPSDALEPAQRLIDEHIRLYHRAQPEHKASTQDKHSVPQDEHKQSAQSEHTLSTEARAALTYILGELEAGNRPTITEIAGKLEITTVALGRMLNPLGLKAHNTHKDGKSAKVYEPAMKAKIKEILEKK